MSLQNLFVAKLPRNLSDADLHSIFADYEPSSAKIMLDAATGKSKGFGFVLFDSEEKGTRAYESLNKTHVTIHNHNFNLCVFPSKHDGKVATEESNALYIRNIPRTLSQMQVEVFLRNFGNLSYCAMREDHYGSPVWVVYAEYDTVDGAKNALTKLHGNKTYFHDYPAAVLAKYADSEEAKRVRRKRRDEVASQLDVAGHYPAPNRIAHGRTKSQDCNPAISVLSHTSSNTSTPPPGFGHQEGHVASVVVGKPNGSAPLPTPNLHTNGYISPNASQTVMVSNDGHHRKNGSCHSIAPLVSTFLNVNPPTALPCNGNCHSFSHYSNHEPSPNGRGTPCTPLSFSFNGNIPDPQQATENTNHAAASNNLCPSYFFNGGSNNNSFAPATPVRRSSNLSTSGTYRHNPYAPVTPINSGASSVGSNSPLTKPLTPSNCQVNVNTHVGHVGGSNSSLHFLQHAYHPIGASPNTVALHNAGMSGYSYSGHFSSPSIFATKTFLEPAS